MKSTTRSRKGRLPATWFALPVVFLLGILPLSGAPDDVRSLFSYDGQALDIRMQDLDATESAILAGEQIPLQTGVCTLPSTAADAQSARLPAFMQSSILSWAGVLIQYGATEADAEVMASVCCCLIIIGSLLYYYIFMAQ